MWIESFSQDSAIAVTCNLLSAINCLIVEKLARKPSALQYPKLNDVRFAFLGGSGELSGCHFEMASSWARREMVMTGV